MSLGRAFLPSFRLVDGVLVAAVALLGLKVLGLFGGPAGPAPAENHVLPPRGAEFGRVLSHARSNYVPADPTTTGSIEPVKGVEPTAAKDGQAGRDPAPPPLNGASPSERILMERLGERREELQQRSREMEARERIIQEQERKLDDRLKEMKAADETGKTAPAAQKAAAENGALKNVVVMYETMKPKEAARIFDRLPLEVLLSVVGGMNSRKMAEILAVMTPESAEKLTIALARRTDAPGDAKPAAVAAGLPAGELPAVERPGSPRR